MKSNNSRREKRYTDTVRKQDLINILHPFPIQTDGKIEFRKYNRDALVRNIIEKSGPDAYHLIKKYIDLSNDKNIILNTTSPFNIKFFDSSYYTSVVNLKRVNDIRHLNKFFETVNNQLPAGSIFICCAETKNLRKRRILRKFPWGLNYIYYSCDFIFKRIFPKHPLTKKFYFWLTSGRNRVFSKPEILGRLYSCGFEVLDEKKIGNLNYFISRKIKSPDYNEHPSYGFFLKQKRIGKYGKLINVYKIRTMHPYSEYIQEYIYNTNKLEEGGKFKDDFRITTLGKILRKFWIDEIPMLLNLFNGDIKLVGVRPLSKQFFSLYPEDFRKIRSKYKPGLFPPYYKDLPKSFDQIIESEKKYLEAYSKNPVITDIKYFSTIIYNIIFKRARSK